MGDAPVLHIVCTGEGPLAGGLALLCAPWAALHFPTANADAITFGASWVGGWRKAAAGACCCSCPTAWGHVDSGWPAGPGLKGTRISRTGLVLTSSMPSCAI